MKLQSSLILSACCLMMVCTGCTAPRSTARAQSPDGAAWDVTPASMQYSIGDAHAEATYDHMYGTDVSFHSAQGFPSSPGDRYARAGGRRQQRMPGGQMPSVATPWQSTYSPVTEDQLQYNPTAQVEGGTVVDGFGSGRQVPTIPYANRCPQCRWGQYDCYPGGCPYCGADFVRHMPRHYHSYSYHVPKDLTYPPPNVPGGAVVYPYYTHKGPSDFFRE